MCTLTRAKRMSGNSPLPHWWHFDGKPGKNPRAGNQTPNHSSTQWTAKLSVPKWVYCSIGSINQIVRETGQSSDSGQSKKKTFELLGTGVELMTTRDRCRRRMARDANSSLEISFPPNCIYCWLQLKGFLLPWLQCNYGKFGTPFGRPSSQLTEKLAPHIDPVFIKKEDAERKTEGQV